MIPFAFVSKFGVGGLVTGADGDLVVLSGQTVDIAEGSVKHYNSLTVNSGGTLRITGTTGAWTEIGCKGNCTINGTILARAGYDGQQTHNGGTFIKESAFGLGVLSYTITQRNGGNGGKNTTVKADTFPGGNGGVQINGIGGGGGGMGTGSYYGNHGENGVPRSLSHGTNGTQSVNSIGGGGNGGASTGTLSRSGGGGGYKGHHGKGLVLYVEGELTGAGLINVSGRAGFNGGISTFDDGTYSGGGGGPGAGGSGGKIVCRYKTGAAIPTSIAGGAAGTTPLASSLPNGATNPTAAQAGDTGSIDLGVI